MGDHIVDEQAVARPGSALDPADHIGTTGQFSDVVAQLIAMGFEAARAAEALSGVGQNVDAAIDWLTSNSACASGFSTVDHVDRVASSSAPSSLRAAPYAAAERRQDAH